MLLREIKLNNAWQMFSSVPKTEEDSSAVLIVLLRHIASHPKEMHFQSS
jgi:hypothetical protein